MAQGNTEERLMGRVLVVSVVRPGEKCRTLFIIMRTRAYVCESNNYETLQLLHRKYFIYSVMSYFTNLLFRESEIYRIQLVLRLQRQYSSFKNSSIINWQLVTFFNIPTVL